jgi:hypothetical protein
MKTKKRVTFNDKVTVRYYNKDTQISNPIRTNKNNKMITISVLLFIILLLVILY